MPADVTAKARCGKKEYAGGGRVSSGESRASKAGKHLELFVYTLQAVNRAVQCANFVALQFQLLFEVSDFAGMCFSLREILGFKLAL